MTDSASQPFVLRATGAPTREATRADPAATLLWLKERFAQIYSAKRVAQGAALVIDLTAYMDIYGVVHDYSTLVTSARDIYQGLEQAIHACCRESHGLILQSAQVTEEKVDARGLLQAYNRHWTAFLDTTSRVNHLLRFFERHFIKREIDEGRKGIYCIRPLHFQIWAEEILGVDTASSQSLPLKPSEVLSAVLELQQRKHEAQLQDDARWDVACQAAFRQLQPARSAWTMYEIGRHNYIYTAHVSILTITRSILLPDISVMPVSGRASDAALTKGTGTLFRACSYATPCFTWGLVHFLATISEYVLQSSAPPPFENSICSATMTFDILAGLIWHGFSWHDVCI